MTNRDCCIFKTVKQIVKLKSVKIPVIIHNPSIQKDNSRIKDTYVINVVKYNVDECLKKYVSDNKQFFDELGISNLTFRTKVFSLIEASISYYICYTSKETDGMYNLFQTEDDNNFDICVVTDQLREFYNNYTQNLPIEYPVTFDLELMLPSPNYNIINNEDRPLIIC